MITLASDDFDCPMCDYGADIVTQPGHPVPPAALRREVLQVLWESHVEEHVEDFVREMEMAC